MSSDKNKEIRQLCKSAKSLYKQELYNQTCLICSQILASTPNDYSILVLHAAALQRSTAALDTNVESILTHAISLRPADSLAWYGLASYYERQLLSADADVRLRHKLVDVYERLMCLLEAVDTAMHVTVRAKLCRLCVTCDRVDECMMHLQQLVTHGPQSCARNTLCDVVDTVRTRSVCVSREQSRLLARLFDTLVTADEQKQQQCHARDSADTVVAFSACHIHVLAELSQWHRAVELYACLLPDHCSVDTCCTLVRALICADHSLVPAHQAAVERVLLQRPQHVWSLIAQAEVTLHSGDLAKALPLLQYDTTQDVTSVACVYVCRTQAHIYWRMHMYDDAILCVQRALACQHCGEALTTELWLTLCRLYLLANRPRDCQSTLQTAGDRLLLTEPHSTVLADISCECDVRCGLVAPSTISLAANLLSLRLAYYTTVDARAVIDAYLTVTTDHEYSGEESRLLMELCWRQEYFERALQFVKLTVTLEPYCSLGFCRLGQCWLLRDPERAIVCLEHATTLWPLCAEAYVTLDAVYYRRDPAHSARLPLVSRALSRLQHARDRQDHVHSALYVWALWLSALLQDNSSNTDSVSATQCLQSLLHIDATCCHQKQGEPEVGTGETEVGAGLVSHVIRHRALVCLADLLYARGSLNSALGFYRQAHRLHADNLYVRVRVAFVTCQMGDLHEALDTLCQLMYATSTDQVLATIASSSARVCLVPSRAHVLSARCGVLLCVGLAQMAVMFSRRMLARRQLSSACDCLLLASSACMVACRIAPKFVCVWKLFGDILYRLLLFISAHRTHCTVHSVCCPLVSGHDTVTCDGAGSFHRGAQLSLTVDSLRTHALASYAHALKLSKFRASSLCVDMLLLLLHQVPGTCGSMVLSPHARLLVAAQLCLPAVYSSHTDTLAVALARGGYLGACYSLCTHSLCQLRHSTDVRTVCRVYCNLGALALLLGDLMFAYKAFIRAQSVYPQSSACWSGLAYCSRVLQPSESFDLFSHASILSGDQFVACYGLLRCVVETVISQVADVSEGHLAGGQPVDSTARVTERMIANLLVCTDWMLEYVTSLCDLPHLEGTREKGTDCESRDVSCWLYNYTCHVHAAILFEHLHLYEACARAYTHAERTLPTGSAHVRRAYVRVNLARVLLHKSRASESLRVLADVCDMGSLQLECARSTRTGAQFESIVANIQLLTALARFYTRDHGGALLIYEALASLPVFGVHMRSHLLIARALCVWWQAHCGEVTTLPAPDTAVTCPLRCMVQALQIDKHAHLINTLSLMCVHLSAMYMSATAETAAAATRSLTSRCSLPLGQIVPVCLSELTKCLHDYYQVLCHSRVPSVSTQHVHALHLHALLLLSGSGTCVWREALRPICHVLHLCPAGRERLWSLLTRLMVALAPTTEKHQLRLAASEQRAACVCVARAGCSHVQVRRLAQQVLHVAPTDTLFWCRLLVASSRCPNSTPSGHWYRAWLNRLISADDCYVSSWATVVVSKIA